MPPRITIIPAGDLPDDLRATLTRWQRANFPDPATDPFVWEKPEWQVFVFVGDEPVSALGIHRRTATVNGQPVYLGGIGSVDTPAEHRRQGYSTAALRQAAAFMRDTIGADFGLLVTGKNLIPFYGRLGWQAVRGPTWCDHPRRGRVILPHVVMVLPLTGRAWPDGDIDLCGLPW